MSATQRHETARRGGKARGASLALHSRSAEETRRLGEALGGLLAAGDVILLTGELGAGKTAFTQGIARGLGVPGVVNSPTFTLLKEYQGRLPLYHFDLYRIENPAELEELGFGDYFFGDGVSVVEWAERGEPAAGTGEGDEAPWPADALRIRIGIAGPQERALAFIAAGPRGRALLAGLASAARTESETR